jgi:gas vesicle protein
LLGAVAGLLLAPQPGDELQSLIRERYDEVMEEGRRAAAERRAELEAQFADAKRAPRPA